MDGSNFKHPDIKIFSDNLGKLNLALELDHKEILLTLLGMTTLLGIVV